MRHRLGDRHGLLLRGESQHLSRSLDQVLFGEDSKVSFASLSSTLSPKGRAAYLVNVGQDSSSGDRGPDQAVQLFVTANRQLQMPRRDTLDPQVLGRVSGQFENLGSEVLEDRRGVDGRLGSDTHVVLGTRLQVTMDTTDRELKPREEQTGHVSMSNPRLSRK